MATTVTSLRLASAMARSTLRPMRPKPEMAILTGMECSQFDSGDYLAGAPEIEGGTASASKSNLYILLQALVRSYERPVNATVAFPATASVREPWQTTVRLLTLPPSVPIV